MKTSRQRSQPPGRRQTERFLSQIGWSASAKVEQFFSILRAPTGVFVAQSLEIVETMDNIES
jgi:hypothetical protein